MSADTTTSPPVFLDHCGETLPTRPATQVLPFTQLVVLDAPAEAAVPGYRLPRLPKPAFDADALAQRLGSLLPRRRPAGTGSSPPIAVDELRDLLAEAFPDRDLPVLDRIEQLAPALSAALAPAVAGSLDGGDPVLALWARFEQHWQPLGYTRGELLASIGLAPGEQLQLEVHSWDKSTRRSETELMEESERRLSRKLTQRDSEDVVAEIAEQSSRKLSQDFRLGFELPLESGATASGGGSSANELATELGKTLKNSASHAAERVSEASESLRSQRKLRIEVARDSGREERQTRTLANANRGHSLNCHYFEVLASYRVETALRDVQACALLPIPRERVTRDWVLVHEDSLRASLRDPLFAAGFAAARLLATCERMEALRAAATATADAAAAGSIQPIVDAYRTLDAAGRLLVATLASDDCRIARLGGPPVLLGVVLWKMGGRPTLERALARAALEHWPATAQALADLAASGGGAVTGDGLARRLDSAAFATPPSLGVLSDGLARLGAKLGPVATLLAALIGGSRLDDAGLAAAVQRLLSTRGSGDGGHPAGGGYATGDDDAYTRRERATAEVEFERLRAHLELHWAHYQQAIWLGMNPDDRARWLSSLGPIATHVDPRLLGFHGHKAIYAIRDPAVLAASGLAPDLCAQLAKTVALPPPFELSLPTTGTTMEAHLGQCDACEDYIRDSRALELDRGRAEARQLAAEADRRERRLAATPPLLEEFEPRGTAALAVDLTGSGKP
jgi:hypothetical protein